MKILIEGKPAAIKQGSSFDFIMENRLFMGRDGYTLNITFPLVDCPENREIFGHINRMDVGKENTPFEGMIIDAKISIPGVFTIVKISEKEVDCQFAQGRCAQTVQDPFNDIYINQMDLGLPDVFDPARISPMDAWSDRRDCVALPWINKAAPLAANNWVSYSGEYSWHEDVKRLSWMPYLIFIAKKICAGIGYTFDFRAWEFSYFRYLIVCNTLPSSWDMPDFKTALPHWTVMEFFEKLEIFMCCEFEFDHVAQSVTMRFSKDVIADIKPIIIQDVVDSYTTEIKSDGESSCKYIATKRLEYKKGSDELWKFYSCDWYMASQPKTYVYDSLEELLFRNKRVDRFRGSEKRTYWGEPPYRGSLGESARGLLYAKDVDTYFCFRSIGTESLGTSTLGSEHFTQVYVIQPVNVFGSGCTESDNKESEEIEFVPAVILDTYISPTDDKGYMLTLEYSADNDIDEVDSYRQNESSDIAQPGTATDILAGEEEDASAYFDEIVVGFWDGRPPEPGKPPYPIIDSVMPTQSWEIVSRPYHMRISGDKSDYQSAIPQINPQLKFKFSWLSDEIPDPRAIFYIRGKRYLCEKITAKFSTNGMSQLLQGEFYPLLDTEDDSSDE